MTDNIKETLSNVFSLATSEVLANVKCTNKQPFFSSVADAKHFALDIHEYIESHGLEQCVNVMSSCAQPKDFLRSVEKLQPVFQEIKRDEANFTSYKEPPKPEDPASSQQCMRCLSFYTSTLGDRQERRADEGATQYVKCRICGYSWKM